MSRKQANYRRAFKSTFLDEDMGYGSNKDWQHKARALQVRRWRAMKREMRGGY